MTIRRVGQSFVEMTVPGENGGIRALARINSIQLVLETDCIGNEINISVAGRTLRIDATMDQLRKVLIGPSTWERKNT